MNRRQIYTHNITEEEVLSLTGKYISAPQNTHTGSAGESVNAWFAGQVAGYEKAVISFDYMNQEFLSTPLIYINLLMTDGAGWVLSKEELEIQIITKEEFDNILAEHLANQVVDNEIKRQIEDPVGL
ncbi:hypothetical protein [Paenibacillus sp. FSL R7-0128]|uniref:hypothetical protein n=1 Tax=Paenibacillus sp. FSL R7-0128 TaxID=2954529 RepID=UPI0030FBC7BC